jgi:hypothetical protein
MQKDFISPKMGDFFHGNEESLFCHTNNEPETDLLKARKIIKTSPTNWGSYTLLLATANLLEEALQKDFTHFCLISESHHPLVDFQEAETILCNERSTFEPQPESLSSINLRKNFIKRGLTKAFKPILKDDVLRFCFQWFSVNRKDAEILSKKLRAYAPIYRKCTLVDEIIPLSILIQHGSDINYGPLCYTSWKPTSKTYEGLCERRYPRTFFKVKKRFLDNLREMGYTFVRKVHPQTTYEI